MVINVGHGVFDNEGDEELELGGDISYNPHTSVQLAIVIYIPKLGPSHKEFAPTHARKTLVLVKGELKWIWSDFIQELPG